MTEPQTPQPPPPPAAAPAPKKKLGPLAWVLIGCLGLLLVIGGCFAIGSFFVAKKVKDVAQDFEANPAKSAAELMVKMNPELELVESDADAGTLTVRNRETGETATLDFTEIAEGRFSWETDEGEGGIDISGDAEGGRLTVRTDEGEATYGSGGAADELPAWVPRYPDAQTFEASFSSRSDESVSGLWTMTTDDPLDQVKERYGSLLEEAGFEVEVRTMAGPEGEIAFLSAGTEDGSRTVNVSLNQEGEGTSATIQYSGSPD